MAGEAKPAPEDLQQQVEALKKERELLDAEKQVLESQKSASDARRAQSDASLAALKASLGDVPASGITGGVDVKDKTGVLEAALLAARAVRDAAASIGISVRRALPDGAHVVAMTAGDVPAFLNMTAYDTEVALVEKALADAVRASERPPTGPRPESVPLAGAAGLVLDATTKLLSFFNTDYTVAGIAVSLDDVIALNEVAGDLSQDRVVPGTVARKRFDVTAPAIYDPGARVAAARFFLDDVARLSVLRQKADALIRAQDEQIARLTAAAESEADATTRQALQAQATAQRALASGLRAAIALMDAWYGKLGTPDEKGVAALVNVSREKALASRIDSGSLLLVKIQAAGGSYLTKKNLWVFAGGMPLFHMGGAAVSFTLLDGRTGTVQAAGVVPIHGGFVKTGDMRATLGTAS